MAASTAPPFMRRAIATRAQICTPFQSARINPVSTLAHIENEPPHKPHATKPHCPTICAVKRVPSYRSFAFLRSFVIRFFEAPSLQSIAHRALSPHITRRFLSQTNQKSASAAPPFLRRALAKRAPGAHRHGKKSIHLPPRPARPAPQKPPPATYYGSNPLRAPIDPARFV